MNRPHGWKEVGHDWFDGPNRTQVALRINIDNTRWYATLRGQERATKEEAERDAERLAFALEPPPDREGLARALLGAFYDDVEQPLAEGEHARIWLSVADTAIRLCGGVREDIEPREPFHVTADRIAKEATDLRAELTRERLTTRAAIDSRDQADAEVGALRDGIQRIKGDLADAQQEARVLRDRIKFLEANLQQVHHDRDAQRAVVDHLRDIIVDIARGQR